MMITQKIKEGAVSLYDVFIPEPVTIQVQGKRRE
jgi:hypothetical protein